ncbi:MAG: sugar ABC transporter ATP-binding protein [Tepidisphaeraceae bacterium]
MADNAAAGAPRPARSDPGAPLLEMRGIQKSFPGVKAVRKGELTLRRGEVVALIGENGAGKSTLMKILAGAHRPDAGRILIDGRAVQLRSPLEAQRLGISMIYQELDLVPTLTARENIFLGRERSRAGWIAAAAEADRARELFRRLNVNVDPEALVGELTVAQQQSIAIAKALSGDAKIVVMDEPSAPLTPQEVMRLFAIIRDLQSHGIGVIYISHRLDEIFRIADWITVMRDGEHVSTQPVKEMTRRRLIELMVGRSLDNEFPKDRGAAAVGPDRLVVRGLSRGTVVRDVSFAVRRGEILALTGLVGAGRTEVVRLIFGADHRDAGSISLDGRALRIRSPRDAIRAGICLLTEDRKHQGLVLGAPVRENFSLPNLRILSRLGFVKRRRERDAFGQYVRSLRIKVPDQDVAAGNLSGGNQQKVVLAKWLQANGEVVIFDEPTRGIDVGAKYEIYLLMIELASQGKAVLMISSELPEVLGVSDRILVMREGRICGEITDVAGATQEDVMALAVG